MNSSTKFWQRRNLTDNRDNRNRVGDSMCRFFDIFLVFIDPKFGNLWNTSHIMFFMLDIKFRFVFGESDKSIGVILVVDVSLLQQRFLIHRLLVTSLRITLKGRIIYDSNSIPNFMTILWSMLYPTERKTKESSIDSPFTILPTRST